MNIDTNGLLSSQCKCCSWEKEFSTRQKFNLGDEDRTFVQSPQSSSDEGQADDSNKKNNNYNDQVSDVGNEVEDGLNDSDDDCSLSDENVVRYFLEEQDESQQYLDLLEEVGGFCQHTSLKCLRNGTEDNSGVPVAILHEIGCTGHSRPYQGPLAQKQLYENLRRKVECELSHISNTLLVQNNATHLWAAIRLQFGRHVFRQRR